MSATIFGLGPPYQLIKTGLAVAASGTFFTVAGGRVRVLEMAFRVTTVFGAGATTMFVQANVAGIDTPLCAASAALANTPAQSMFMVTGDPAAALFVPVGAGAVRGPIMDIVVNPCTIDSVIAGGTTGDMTAYVLWTPIDPGATLT